MKVKRYRAATMREALERVKRDIGEDALVLETKQVRSGGFLGYGGRDEFEVRVAADQVNPRITKPRKSNPTAHSTSLLNLTEDAPALPDSERQSPKSYTRGLSALSARAYAPKTNKSADLQSDTGQRSQVLQTVELSDETPAFVPVSQNRTATSVRTVDKRSETVSERQKSNSDLEGLRAELREVKFTLGTMSARQQWSNGNGRSSFAIFEQDPQIYDTPYYEPFLDLTSSGLAPELARRAVRAAFDKNPDLLNGSAGSAAVAAQGLIEVLSSEIRFAADPLAVPMSPGTPNSVMAFIGPTGVGKTTTIAKLAARIAVRERRHVELITLDTFRIAAVEQLKTYADIIGTGCHVARSVLELDALRRRLQENAIVLIDSIGKSPHDLADQMELADYMRNSTDIVKALVLQGSTQPDDSLVSASKFGLYGASCLVITKLDETARPGTIASIISTTGLPLVYLGTGQRVPEDIEQATPQTFAAQILKDRSLAVAA